VIRITLTPINKTKETVGPNLGAIVGVVIVILTVIEPVFATSKVIRIFNKMLAEKLFFVFEIAIYITMYRWIAVFS
jgi:hypothetical protein